MDFQKWWDNIDFNCIESLTDKQRNKIYRMCKYAWYKNILKPTILKPCPFCGEQAVRVSHPGINWDGSDKNINIGAHHDLWYVGCPSKFFEGSVSECEACPSLSWYVNLSEAEKHWNTRK